MPKWAHRLSNINTETKTGQCASCGQVDLYYKKYKDLWECRNKRNQNKAKRRGTIGSGFVSGTCQICGLVSDKLVYDHDHKTKVFRGWLCLVCNMALGSFKDDPNILRNAIKYLNSG